MTLIDKELIRAEIERRIEYGKFQYDHIPVGLAPAHYFKGVVDTLEEVLAFLDTLPESAKRGYKDCNGCEYNRTIKDQIGWQFRGCFGGEYKGKPIAEIELCPLKVDTLPEQPELKPMNIPSAGSGAMGTTPPKFKLDVKPEQPAEGLEEEMEKFFLRI